MAYGNTRGRILIQATVVNIKDNQVLYPACKQCYSKLQHEHYDKVWVCLKCCIAYEKCKVEWRYRLLLRVANKTTLTDIALFGKTLEPYFGTSAGEFKRFLDRVDESNLLEENMLLESLEETFLGQSFIFGIKSEAQLKELQKHHGSMSPVSASTVHRVKFGDHFAQSDMKSDLVAVQILSTANVSFTGNTVLYNLKLLTDLNWEFQPDKSEKKLENLTVDNCSYLPYTTIGTSNYSYSNSGLQSAIELSYEKSIEQSRNLDIFIDRSADNLDEENLSKITNSLDWGEQKDIKTQNNHSFRSHLSNNFSSKTDFNNSSDVSDKCLRNDFNLKTAICNESSLEILRHNGGGERSTCDQSYLEFSHWGESFNPTSSESQFGIRKSQIRMTQDTLLDFTQTENVLYDPSFSDLPIDFPEIVAPVTQSKSTSLSEFSKHDTFVTSAINKNIDVCDMPESEDLSKFLENDSFENEIMTENLDFERIYFSNKENCDIENNPQKIVNSVNQKPTLEKISSSAIEKSCEDIVFKNEDESTFLEDGKTVTHCSVVSSQVLLDRESEQVKQCLALNSDVPGHSTDVSVIKEEKNFFNGNDSQDSVSLFSDDDASSPVQIQPSFSFDNQNIDCFRHKRHRSSVSHKLVTCSQTSSNGGERSSNDSSVHSEVEVLRKTTCSFDPNILSESLFSQTIIENESNLSELLLGINLNHMEENENVTKISTRNPFVDKDLRCISNDFDTDSEDADLIAMDLCDLNPFACSNKGNSVVEKPGSKDKIELPVSETICSSFPQGQCVPNESEAEKTYLAIAPVNTIVDNVPFDDSVNDAEFLALSFGSSDNKCGDELSKSKNIMSVKIQSDKNIGLLNSDMDVTGNTELDVTDDGSVDLFDNSESVCAPNLMNKSAINDICAIDNSFTNTSEHFQNLKSSPCCNQKMKISRRPNCVRHSNLIDVRLNMCKTSSPLTNPNSFRSNLDKMDACILEDSVFTQDVYSPSPIKSQETKSYCSIGSPNVKLGMPSENKHSFTPVLKDHSISGSMCSPDLFSP